MSQAALAIGVSEACTAVGCSRAKLYREVRAGRLRARKLGRRTIVLSEDLERWLRALPALATSGREAA